MRPREAVSSRGHEPERGDPEPPSPVVDVYPDASAEFGDSQSEPVAPVEPVEIVDIAQLEELKRERKRAWTREAQRRWRKNHPEKHKEANKKWRQKPEVKARLAAYHREWYLRKKEEALSVTHHPIDNTNSTG